MRNITFYRQNDGITATKMTNYTLKEPIYLDKLEDLVSLAMAELKPGTLMETPYGSLRVHPSGEYATAFTDLQRPSLATKHIEAARAKQLPRTLLKREVTQLLTPIVRKSEVKIDGLYR